MNFAALHADEGPLSRGGYLVVAFDPRSGRLGVYGDMSYAPDSFEDAVASARDAAAISADRRLPFEYAVIQFERVAAYRPV